MHVTDWLPTFLSMAGANSSDILPNIDGIDQWQSLKQNSTPSPRSELLYNIDPHPPGKMNKVQGMAHKGLKSPKRFTNLPEITT